MASLTAIRRPSTLSFEVSAPGKVILHGEHSVVYGKLAVAASLGLRTYLLLREQRVTGSPMDIKALSIHLKDLNLMHSYDIQGINKLLFANLPLLKPQSYFNHEHPELLDHETFVNRIKEFVERNGGSEPLSPMQFKALVSFFYLYVGILSSVDIDMLPLAISVQTELTVGAGMGSSASFAVCVAAAFYEYIKIKSSSEIYVSRRGFLQSKQKYPISSNFTKVELDLISQWAYNAERIIHGTPSGIDNSICTFGTMLEFRKGGSLRIIPLEHELKLLLVDTNVTRETKTLVERVSKLRNRHQEVVDSIFNCIENVSAKAISLLTTVSRLQNNSLVDLHGQVTDYYTQLGELVDINQSLLAAINVSHPAIETICSMLKEVGLHGKLTGAGGGGYVIAVIPPFVHDGVMEKLGADLVAKGFKWKVVSLGSPGVTVI